MTPPILVHSFLNTHEIWPMPATSVRPAADKAPAQHQTRPQGGYKKYQKVTKAIPESRSAELETSSPDLSRSCLPSCFLNKQKCNLAEI